MFTRKRTKDYEEYVDYESELQDVPEELEETREFQLDSQYDREWSPGEEEHYYPDSSYSDDNFGEEFPTRSQRRQYNEAQDAYVEQTEFDYQEADAPEAKEQNSQLQRRSKYNARIDRFLNNGIIIVGVLLIIVLVIAFLL